MATYCLLAFWLVERFNWCSTHCFTAVDASFSKCNSTFTRFETLLRASNTIKLELYYETARKLRHEPWNNWKIPKVTVISMRKDVLFLHIHEGEQASKNTDNLRSTSPENNTATALTWSTNYRKPDEYKSRKQHFSGTNMKHKLRKTWRVQV